jgi:hypothetical protein
VAGSGQIEVDCAAYGCLVQSIAEPLQGVTQLLGRQLVEQHQGVRLPRQPIVVGTVTLRGKNQIEAAASS